MKERKYLQPLLYSLMVFIAVSISEKLGFSKYSTPSIEPISWKVFLYIGLPKAFCISLLLFLVLYFWKINKTRNK